MANPPTAPQMAVFFQSRASEMLFYQGIHLFNPAVGDNSTIVNQT